MRHGQVANGEVSLTCVSIQYSPDCRYIAAGWSSGGARVYDALSGECVAPPFPNGALCYSPDGQLLASLSVTEVHLSTGEFCMWDAPTPTSSSLGLEAVVPSAPTEQRRRIMTALASWPSGDIIATAFEDGVVCVPQDLIVETVELAQKGRDVDAKCLEDIRAGVGVAEAFKRHRGK